MRLYLSAPLCEKKSDPIAYWIKCQESMNQLANSAFKYLCVPATSVPFERVFSKAGQVCTERRNRLNPKNVDIMVFLNANEKFGN